MNNVKGEFYMVSSSSPPIVLVIDDNPLNQELLKIFLSALSCEGVGLTTGDDVTDMVKRYRPAVVLMDIQMAGLSGFDALAELKADVETRDVPVYAFTALTPQKLADYGDLSLFSGVLRKPPMIEDVRKILEAVGAIYA